MRIGVIGGTFDPVHLGHLLVAEEARQQLRLERVLFVPAGIPWMKIGARTISPVRHRLAMVRRAIAGNPKFEISRVDLERLGKTYSVDTLVHLRQYIGPQAHFYFIIGWDGLRSIPGWKNPQSMVKMCYLVAAPRPGVRRPDMEQLEKEVPGIARRIIMLEMTPVGISSTDIRRRVAEGRSIRYLVPLAVERYISRHRLYLG